MTTIVTRTETQTDGTAAKGSELTWSEVDTNFINLNDNKVEVSGAIIFAAKAGEALTKGDVVYVSGVSGNEPVVSKADADVASKMPAFGLAETDANLNAAVNVVTFGTIYDLDTSGFTAGDTVYVSTTAGGLTATKPAGEASLIQNMGRVIRSHASAGSIKVGGAGRSNDTPNLNDGNVFIGNASNQAEARALVEADISDFGTYLTSYTETDPVFSASPASGITSTNITNWNTAYGWGNHASAGYAPTANPTFTGIATAPTIRLTTTTDVSLSSTGHAFQIGPTSSLNIAMDDNEIMARNNGSTSTLYLNNDGGSVSVNGTAFTGTDIGNWNSAYSDTSAATSANTANAIVKRDGSGDFSCRYVYSNFLNMSHGVGTRSGDTIFYSSTDNYIRKTNATGMRNALSVYSKSEIDSAGYSTFDGTGYNTYTTTADWNSNFIGTAAGVTFRKTGWSYAGNANLTDAGNFTETAGASFLKWSDGSRNTVLAIAPNTGGSAHRVMIYNDQGSGYNPGWREIHTDKNTCVAPGFRPTNAGTLRDVTGQYGSIEVDGGATGGYEGYSIGGRVVFMHNNGSTTGIYNDVNNEWLFRAVHNAATYMYYNGSSKIYTYSSGGRVTGNLLATSNVYAYYSDERLKDKTGKIENALDKVGAIETFYYTHNDIANELGYEGKEQQVGVSAQSVAAVMPEVVHLAPIDDDGEGNSVSGENYQTVDYPRLVPLLLEAIKELTAEVEALKNGASD